MTHSPLAHALDALQRGMLVGVPTDTVYGVAADPFNREAVALLYKVKQRDTQMPIPVLGADAGAFAGIADLTGPGAAEASSHWPGGLTVVVPKSVDAPPWIGDERGTVAIRVPDHPVALELLRSAGPLAVTSANRSGDASARTADEARFALGYGVAVYLEGDAHLGEASTVVDLSGSEPVVLRQGPVRLDPK
jgi:tRNA threonylcarbamoyl adenosine modification protein (Sua5/YciO/YrdC/YwlC family)